jgi:DNA-binding response OmpR family regulator
MEFREASQDARLKSSLAMQTVLVIDDDSNLRDTVGVLLETEGFRPVLAGDGQTGFQQALTLQPELILVDLKMPGLSGAEVCKQIRGRGMKIPLIVLSAAGEEMSKVELLDMGADDYLVKPFRVRELLARVRAVLRRATPDETVVMEFADVQVDFTRRAVKKQGQETNLTRAEYNLLTYFLQNPDRVLTREVILSSVWGYNCVPHTRTVDAHVVRLRQKLEPDAGRPQHFLTVHGVGYRFLP